MSREYDEALTWLKLDYEGLGNHWQNFVNLLLKIDDYQSEKPTYDQAGKQLVYSFTEIPVFARFRSTNKRGMIEYGYILPDGLGRDTITGKLFFDEHGNILEDGDLSQARFSMKDKNDIGVFHLSQLVNACHTAHQELISRGFDGAPSALTDG